jgi:3-dehydroquinate dehydratase
MFMNVLVINGPNLARLDIRDSSIYGDLSYPQLVEYISKAASGLGFSADVRQSDDESTIIGWLHEAADSKTPVIINPAAFTHYSYAIRDAAAEKSFAIHLSSQGLPPERSVDLDHILMSWLSWPSRISKLNFSYAKLGNL